MYGSFSESSLNALESLFDFTRCVRPDGSVYGTGGKCRKGTETGAKAEPAPAAKAKTPKLSKNEKIALQVMADKSLRSDKKRIAEMVRLGVPRDTDFVALVGSTKDKIGLRAGQTIRGSRAKAKTADSSQQKSLAERMAAAAEKLEKDKPEAKPKPGPKPGPKPKKPEKQVEVQTAAKVKKPKETPEEKAEKKWLAQQEKVKAIEAEHAKMIAEIEKRGHKVYSTGTGATMLHKMARERGIATPSQLTNMRIKLRQEEPERLKQERLAKQREEIAAEIAGTSREKRKEMIREEITRLKGSKYIKTLSELNDHIQMMQKWINEDPSMATLKNLVALRAARALRAQMSAAGRSEREAKYKSLDASLKEAPKYKETPGSRQPAKPKELLGDYASYLKKEKELDARRKEIENSGRLTDPKVQKEYYSLLEEISAHSKGRIPGNPVSLGRIYEIQGFNAKPELVRGRSDLESRKDILRESDGRPLILYRGVTEERYARQFQGSGPDGDKHFPGQGVYGNGTYAASAGANVKESRWITDGNYDQTAQRTAISYAAGGQGVVNRVTAFAIRKDANVVQFEGETTSERDRRYYEWRTEITRQAKERFGLDFNDHGEAAAAMGIHAYRVPMSDSEDYWVILNRGAIIASQDPQLPD